MSRIDQSKIDKILSKRQVSYDHDEQGVDIWQVQSQDLSNVYIISHTPAKSSGDYEFDESWECSCP